MRDWAVDRNAFRPAVFDPHILALDDADFPETLAERGYHVRDVFRRQDVDEANHWHRRLLRTRRKRPRARRTAEKRNELASFHCLMLPCFRQKR
jgi:hypothetical protein